MKCIVTLISLILGLAVGASPAGATVNSITEDFSQLPNVTVNFQAAANIVGDTPTGGSLQWGLSPTILGSPLACAAGPGSATAPFGFFCIFNPNVPAGTTIYIVCIVNWNISGPDRVSAQFILPATSIPPGTKLDYSLDSPSAPQGGSDTIVATVLDANGSPLAGVSVNFNLVTEGATATGNLSATSATTDATGNTPAVTIGNLQITGSGNAGDAKVELVTGNSPNDKHRLVVIHVKG